LQVFSGIEGGSFYAEKKKGYIFKYLKLLKNLKILNFQVVQ